MDDTSLFAPPNVEPTAPAESSRGDRRRKAREILSTQCSRLDRLEIELTDRLQHVADEIARELANSGVPAASGAPASDSQLAALAQQVELLQHDLSAREQSLDRLSAELEQTRLERARFEQELRLQSTLAAEAQALAEQSRVELAESQAETKAERRRLARELKERHAGERSERERHEKELATLQAALATAQAEQDRLIGDLREAAGPRGAESEELAKLRVQRDTISARLTAATEQLAELDRLNVELERVRIESGKYEQELRVRDALIAEAQSRDERSRQELAAALAEAQAEKSRAATLERRLAELDNANAELEQAKVLAANVEQELRVREALLADAQAREEQARRELAHSIEQANAAQATLEAVRLQQDDLTGRLALAQQASLNAAGVQHELELCAARLAEVQTQAAADRAELAKSAEQLATAQAQLAAARELNEAANREADAARREAETARREADAAREEAAAQEPVLKKLRTQLNKAQAEAERLEGELAEAKAETTQLRRELDALTAQQNLQAQQLAAAEARLREAQSAAEELATENSQAKTVQIELAAAQAQAAEAQRLAGEREQLLLESTRYEQELRVRDALVAEAQQHDQAARVELATVEAELKTLRLQWASFEQQSAASGDAEVATLRAQLSTAQKELAAARAEAQAALELASTAHESPAEGSTASNEELAGLRAELQAARELNDRLMAGGSDGDNATALVELQKQRDALVDRLAEAELRLKSLGNVEAEARRHEDMQRRYEMAMTDLKELKRTNAELESKLKSRSDGGKTTAVGSGGMDWEARKQQMLAALEDDDRGDAEAAQERETIQNAIELTDQIVAQKEQEIADLRRQLADRASAEGASTGAAVAELLNSDELIRQEREKLLKAEAEWREKIGRAEIDISVERAKIARDRMELEEKMRLYQSDQSSRAADGAPGAPDKAPRGRWLARLGLKDLNDESQQQ
jgi:chromosome segregation ATPase